MLDKSELPWIEKYRPVSLEDVVGQKHVVERLKIYLKSQNMPNLLFTGPAGVGKTSSSVALARETFKEDFGQNFLELNASDDRGIDVVRNTIKEFARTLPFNAKYKIIFLDECDSLTSDAQQALRRIMEKYTKTCRFILSCNYSSRILEPIQSRCVVFRFRPLEKEDVFQMLRMVEGKEGLKLSDEVLDSIYYVSQGDMRKAVNILQACTTLSKDITPDGVYEISSKARPEEIKEMIFIAWKGMFKDARDLLYKLLFDYSMSGEDLIGQVYREIVNYDEDKIENKEKVRLITIVADFNFRITQGANEKLQLEAMLAQFVRV
jgi:replication factor C small subunit